MSKTAAPKTLLKALLLGTMMLRAMAISCVCAVAAIHTAIPTQAQQHTIERLVIQPPPVAFEHINSSHGLANNAVTCVLQDKQGFLWFGTEDGLCKYDGYTFTTFRNRLRDTSSLSGNFVSSLYQDRTGTLWVGTQHAGGGVSLYNPLSSSFRRLKHDPDNPTSLAADDVFGFAEDKQGNVWVLTPNALSKFDRATQTFSVFKPAFTDSTEGFHGNIAVTPSGDFICCSPRGVYRFVPGKRRFERVVSRAFPSINYLIRQVFDTNGRLWIGFDTVLVAYNPTTFAELASYSRSQFVAGLNATNEEWYILPRLFASNGTFWVTTDLGVHAINPQTGGITSYTHDDRFPQSICDNRIFTIYEDRSGILWFCGIRNGLSLYSPHRHKFELYRRNVLDEQSLSGNYIRGICEGADGTVWVGTQGAGLNALDRTTGKATHYRAVNSISGTSAVREVSGASARRPRNNKNTMNSLHNDGVWSVLEDRRGRLWIGTNDGLQILDRPAKATQGVFLPAPAPIQGLVNVLYEDREGNIWASEGATTIWKIPADVGSGGGKSSTQPQAYNLRSWGNAEYVEAVLEDRRGWLWIGHRRGLVRFSPQTGAWTAYRSLPNDTTTLGASFITNIMEDHSGRLWVATRGGGLSVLNNTEEATAINARFERITESDGLPHGNVYGLVEDKRGGIWVSSDKGVARYDPRNKQWQHFDVTEGLQGEEFNRRAFFANKHGEIFFGGTNGLNVFHPDLVPRNQTLPLIALTSVKITNRTLNTDSLRALGVAPEFTHRDKTLTFGYAALDFTAPERNRYAVMLEPFDADWRAATTKHEVTYTNLDAGSYTFHVKACNSDGTWSDKPFTFQFVVLPPWWQTWWFRSVVVVIAVMAFWLGTQIITRRNEHRRQELERLVERRTAELQSANDELSAVNDRLYDLNNEKNEFLGIAAHDLRNPLAGISLGLEQLQFYPDKMTEAQRERRYQQIQTTIERMKSIIDQLLDSHVIESGAIKIEHTLTDVTALIKELLAEYQERATAKNIGLHIQAAPELHVLIDGDILWQVLENLLSNALKYSPLERTVILRAEIRELQSQELQSQKLQSQAARAVNAVSGNTNDNANNNAIKAAVLRLEVQDDGPGLSAADKEKLFSKFARLSARPTAGEQSVGLGLSIVKKLTEALQGKVWCESELGRGATFIVEIPAGDFRPQPANASVPGGNMPEAK